jgi:flagellar assembly protein FliH
LSSQFLRFKPPRIQAETPEVVQDFLARSTEARNDFVMADVIRVKTKVADFEKRSMNEQIEAQVLERLQEVQEAAYKEGFDVGRSDGRNEAYQEHNADLDAKLELFDTALAGIANIKKELLQANEAHFVKFSLYLAERLAYHEVTTNPEALVQLVTKAIEMAAGEEKVTISLSPEQVEFFETMRKNSSRKLGIDDLKNVIVDADPHITPGGCVVQTNYSEIDARIEERVKMLWELVGEQIFKVRDKISSESA